MPLKEYETLVGTTAAVVTVAQVFSPVFICKKIIKQGNTENIDPTPFIGGFGMSTLMLQLGLLMNDGPTLAVNSVAVVLYLLYSLVYYKYTTEKPSFVKKFIRTMFFALLILAYVQIDLRISPERVETVYSIIITILLFSLIGAPLTEVKAIVSTKNAEKLPFPLIACGTCVTFLWLLYGIIIENVFMQFQNIVGFVLSVVQLALCLMYPPPAAPKDKEKKKE